MKISNPYQHLIDTMPEDMVEGLIDEIRTGRMLERVQAEQNAKQVGRANHAEVRKSIEGLGRLRMEVNADSFFHWGMKEGFKVWEDPSFLRQYERDNPYCRVQSTGTRIQVGFGSCPSNRKFFKRYEPSVI